MTGLLDPPMKAASAIAAGRIMNLLLKFLGREKKIYMYICTQTERERYVWKQHSSQDGTRTPDPI